MGAPTPLVWTISCPWRPPSVILRSSREHFWEMFLIRRRDDRGSEDRSGTMDNGCFGVVERCRYVTGGVKFDLASLPSTADISFVYNTPTPFVMLHCLLLVKLSNELRQIKTFEISLVRLGVVLCISAGGV